jgi:catechol 2,3-dioxygenase-like lactoylglutathione lyase family enzyme
MANIRYIVDDVDAAVEFYSAKLGFEIGMHVPGDFAMLDHSDLRLFLNRPGAGSAGQPDDAGRSPRPGGWNRFQFVVSDLDATLTELTNAGVAIRTGIVGGAGGRQIVIEDPSGNPIELFQPKGSSDEP